MLADDERTSCCGNGQLNATATREPAGGQNLGVTSPSDSADDVCRAILAIGLVASAGGNMDERAFVIQQIGAKDSPERRRADEIFNYVIVPAVKDAGLDPYRADLDLTPGAITPKMLAELLSARVVIADLTGRNPNVFYELGITHSFACRLISIADSSKILPFDAKDERVIELGEYPSTGLGWVQGQDASKSLRDSLRIVLDDNYVAPSPLREVATNRSIDQLANKDPHAAEMAQIREALEDIRKRITPRVSTPQSVRNDVSALRSIVENNVGYLVELEIDELEAESSTEQKKWAESLRKIWESSQSPKVTATDSDPWATDGPGGYSDEPPF